ncbi:MAG: hypothetical protein IKT70_02555 [Clostridia bacterium]|nr:hypothetical protein [Clostridia bacterium]
MVRGCQKKIIHLRDTGSDLFEEAYFIIRPGKAAVRATETDMIREARRILENNRLGDKRPPTGKTHRKRRGALILFSLGAASSGMVSFLIFVLCRLFS